MKNTIGTRKKFDLCLKYGPVFHNTRMKTYAHKTQLKV